MCNDNGYKKVYSISQFARILGISRTSLYQYKEMGILPPPLSCPGMNNRPFYTYELQQRCAEILRTGIGYNGQVVVFNTKRKGTTKSGHLAPKRTRADIYQHLTKIIKQIGINATIDDVKIAIKTICPNGVTNNEADEELIKALYSHFRPDDQNSVRKV